MDRIKNLIQWIAEHSERESAFLSPEPAFYISTESLMDEIRKLFNFSKENINEIIDERPDNGANPS